MKRTTVKISDELDARLRNEAARKGKTVSQVTREALEAHLNPGGRRQLRAAAAGRGGERGVSERVEEILSAEVLG
jgi:predicted DNA-binding protein